MTKNEMILIEHFGLGDAYRRMKECGDSANPVGYMRMAVIEAFMRGECDTLEARALRRGVRAICESNPLRDDPEYEKLIELGPEPKCYDEVLEHERQNSLTPPSPHVKTTT